MTDTTTTTTTPTTTTSGTGIQSVITAGEALYSEVAGNVSPTAASNINDIGAVVALAGSLVERNTSAPIDAIAGNVATIITGVTGIITEVKTLTAKTTTTTAASSTTTTTAAS